MCIHNMNRALFCGNSLEICGLGKVFEGVAEDMLKTSDLL